MFRESASRRTAQRTVADLPVPDPPYRNLIAGSLALDFANTLEPERDDFFPGYGNVLSWFLFAGVVQEDVAGALLTAARENPREAALVRTRIYALRTAIIAAVTEPEDDALRVLTSEWHIALSHQQLSKTDSGVIKLVGPDELALDCLLHPVALNAIQVLVNESGGRIRQCAAAGCTQFFMDTSRGGQRKFCRPETCGTRTRVQRFRNNAIRQ